MTSTKQKEDIARSWLKRYTGTEPEAYGEWILLTNFQNYVEMFAQRFDVAVNGKGGPMTSSTNSDGLSIINFGIGSSNAATKKYTDLHLEIGIQAMSRIDSEGEAIKHYLY